MAERESFEEAVDRVLRGLEPGDLVTYGEVADEAGFPRRARAVGRVLAGSDGRYPWWRVVTSTGRLVPGLELTHARKLIAEGHTVEDGRVRPRPRPEEERFGRDYFDHWYRAEGFGSPARLRRKVDYAIAATEYLLERPVRSVLDVGCGEGEWQPALARRRSAATYLGVDPSRYAVDRFGSRRNLRLGRLGDLDRVLPEWEGPFDLIACVDVLGYASDREVQRGLGAIAENLGGVALIETYTTDDDIVGDTEHFRWRRTSTYERWFDAAGLHRVGPHLYVGEALLPTLVSFERPSS
ncbi:MAG: MGMT family protein [Acidimicrobiales bacterium]|nr:MGMT family protein [Acidimicrobiales bacterium]